MMLSMIVITISR